MQQRPYYLSSKHLQKKFRGDEMNKLKKIVCIVLIFFLIFSIIQSDVQATSVTDLSGKTFSDPEAKLIGNKAITVVTTVGATLSVIVLIVLGIKYMMGSVEEKAEYKKSLMPYMIGCIFVFMATVIATVIYDIMTTL